MSRHDEVMIYMYYSRQWHSGIGTVSSPLESQMMDWFSHENRFHQLLLNSKVTNITRLMLNTFKSDIKFIITLDKKSHFWLSIRGCNLGWRLLFEVVSSEVPLFLSSIAADCENWYGVETKGRLFGFRVIALILNYALGRHSMYHSLEAATHRTRKHLHNRPKVSFLSFLFYLRFNWAPSFKESITWAEKKRYRRKHTHILIAHYYKFLRVLRKGRAQVRETLAKLSFSPRCVSSWCTNTQGATRRLTSSTRGLRRSLREAHWGAV